MFSQKQQTETSQTKTLSGFNDLHKNIIESVIKIHLNDIIQTFIAEPEKAAEALYAMISGVMEKDELSLNQVLDSIEAVRYIITHEAPEDLLKLNKRVIIDKNKNLSEQLITKLDVVRYIVELVFDTIKQFADLKNLMPFIKENKKAIQDLLKSCDAFTIDQFPKIGEKCLARLIKHPTNIHVLFDQMNMPVQEFLKLSERLRDEVIEYALDLANFKVASISWQEILALPDAARALFYKHASSIVNLMQGKKTTFNELKAHAETLEAFIAEKKNPLAVLKPIQTQSILTTTIEEEIRKREKTARKRREEELKQFEETISFYRSYYNWTNFSNGLFIGEEDVHPANPHTTQLITEQDLTTFPPLDTHPYYWPTSSRLPFSNASIFNNRPLEDSIIVSRPSEMQWIESGAIVQLHNGFLINIDSSRCLIIDPANGRTVARFNREGYRLITHITVLQNGYAAACEAYGENIYVYDDIMSDHITLRISHQGYITDLLSMDNYLIAFDRSERPFSVYDIHTGNLINCIKSPYQKNRLLISKNSILIIASDDEDRKYCQWINPLTGQILRQKKLQDHVIQEAILLPHGKLAIADFNSKIYIYDLEIHGKNIFSHKFKVDYMQVIHSLALSDQGHLLIGDSQGRVQEYNYRTGERLHAFKYRDTGYIGTSIALKMLFKRLTAPAFSSKRVPAATPMRKYN